MSKRITWSISSSHRFENIHTGTIELCWNLFRKPIDSAYVGWFLGSVIFHRAFSYANVTLVFITNRFIVSLEIG